MVLVVVLISSDTGSGCCNLKVEVVELAVVVVVLAVVPVVVLDFSLVIVDCKRQFLLNYKSSCVVVMFDELF